MSSLTAGAILQSEAHAYVLERELGSGGFGVTWLARRQADDLPVALKQLHVQRGADPKSLELFKREIATLRRLEHARIPDYVDDFLHDGLVLVQEYVEGHDLSAVVRGEISMDEGQVVSWLAQILEILVYLHGQTPPIIHRDITPRNIIVKPDGTAYLVDFGAVKLGIAGSMASTSTGTFGYAPMEQFVSQAFPASDLYGLGMTAVAVAAGKAPVDMTFARMRVDVRGITQLDPRLTRLLERMTEPDPERRLGDARVALEQLRPLVVRAASEHGGALRHLALRRAATGRAGPDEDLLPSERIREAGLRLQTLERAWDVPPLAEVADDVEGVAISPDGTVIVAGGTVIDADRMTVIGRLGRGLHGIAVGVAGEVVVARNDTHAAELRVLRRTGERFKQVSTIESGPAEHVALSPDGGLLAVITGFFASQEGELLLFDVASGQLNQRVQGKYEAVTFSADGATIAAIDDDNVLHLLSAGGATRRIENCRAVAFSPDGETMAIAVDDRLRIGPRGAPSEGLALKLGGYSMRCPRFSPDGRWFGIFDYSNDRIVVVDLTTGKRLRPILNPGRPGERVGSPTGLGFSADGERLFVGCDIFYNRFVDGDEDCVGVWRIPEREYLGALLAEEDGGAAIAVSAAGFWGPLHAQATPVDPAAPWRRSVVARKLLCGLPVDELIDAPSRAALIDLETRWTFIKALQADDRLDKSARISPLLDALSGLTHVLDLVVEHAREAQAARPTFGGGVQSAVALTGDQLRSAAQLFAGKPAAELSRLHAALIARAEAAEAEAAVQPHVPTKPRAAPTAVAYADEDDPIEKTNARLRGVMVMTALIIALGAAIAVFALL